MNNTKAKIMKVFLLVSLMLILTACKEETPNYLGYLHDDIETADENSLTSNEFGDVIKDTQDERSFDFIFQEQDDYALIRLGKNELFNRDQLVRVDKRNGTLPIPPKQWYWEFERGVDSMKNYIHACENQNPCTTIPYLSDNNSQTTNVTYGFDNSSGFYTVTIEEAGELFRLESFKYKLYENYIDFEKISFIPSNEQYEYTIMSKGILKSYEYTTADSYSYNFIDTTTYETIYFSVSNGKEERFLYFDPKQQISYDYSGTSGTYEVSSYEDFERIVSISKYSSGYDVNINFNFMNDWDQVQCGADNEYWYCHLNNDGQEVFDQYEIYYASTSLYYNEIRSVISIDESDFEEYKLPNELQTSHSLSDLKEILSEFSESNTLMNLFPFSEEDLKQELNDLYEYLDNLE